MRQFVGELEKPGYPQDKIRLLNHDIPSRLPGGGDFRQAGGNKTPRDYSRERRIVMSNVRTALLAAFGAALYSFGLSLPAQAEVPQTWNLVNPAGVIKTAAVEPAPRLSSLEGKTIVLHWNSKPNGDVILNRIAEHLAERVPSATVIKAYEKFPEIVKISATQEKSREAAEKILSLKPYMVIGSTAD